MSEIRRAVDEIRFYLESTEAEMTESIREAARDYFDACRQANQRLRRCGEFLNRNLRSEAIQLAESDPDLLALVATLDFPGRSAWEQAAGLYNLPIGEPLLMEVAEALNESYALQEPVKKLLDKHRLLALSRAPLKQRLAVLWKLVGQDSSLGTWEADACEMEQARLKQIETEARDAAKSADVVTFRELIDEVEGGKWIEPIPPGLRKTLSARSQQAHKTVASNELKHLAGALEAVFQSADLGEASALKERWDVAQSIADLDAFDPLLLRVGPVFRWIAEEQKEDALRQKLTRAEGALSQAIDEGTAPREHLEDLRQRIIALGQPLADHLENRFRLRLDEIERRQKVRRIVIAAASTVCAIAILVVAALLLRRSVQMANSRRVAASLVQLVDDGKLDEARRFANSQGDMFPTDEWQQAQRGLGKAEDLEHNRVAELGDLMATIPKTASYDEARTKLNRAASIAKTDKEKAEIARLDADREERQRAELTAHEGEIGKRADSIRKDLERAEGLVSAHESLESVSPLFDQLSQSIAGLKSVLRDADTSGKRQNADFENRLANLKDLAQQGEQKRTLADALENQSLIRPSAKDSGSRVDTYLATLASFVKQFPTDSRSADFQEVAQESSAYHGLCAWQTSASKWEKLLPGDVNAAKTRLADCEAFLKSHPDCPASGMMTEYSRYLAALVRRYEGDGGNQAEGLLNKLRELFKGPLMQDVYVLWNRDGAAYYLKNEANLAGEGTVNLEYLSDFQGKTAHRAIQERDLKSPKAVRAPQSRLAETALRELDALTLSNWEPCVKRLCHSVLDERDVDPFLRYALFRYTLEYGSAGSQLIEPGLRKPLEMLRSPEIDLSTRWMLPNDSAAETARSLGDRLLARIRDLDSAWANIDETQRSLARALFTPCTFVGVLRKNRDGEWVCASRWQADGNYELVVAARQVGDSVPSWQVIGTVRDRKLKVTVQERSTVLREGRLVIARGTPRADAVAGAHGNLKPEAAP